MGYREKLGFYCPRINYLKMFGPVVDAMRARGSGLDPLVIVPVAPLITYRAKNRDLAAGKSLPEIRAQLGAGVEIATVDSPEAFRRLLSTARVRAVVNVGLRLPEPIVAQTVLPSRREGVRWCALGHLQEEFFHLLEDGLRQLDHWDVATTFSRRGVEFFEGVLRERGERDTSILSRLQPIGFVELDQVGGFSREALRRKYDLPADRPVVYFSTAPRFHLLKPAGMGRAFFRTIWGGLGARRAARRLWSVRWPEVDWLATYRDCLGCVGEFARRNGAVLIAKTRPKHADPGYVVRSVDRVFGDGAFYPFRTLELMFLSDLYVGMPSASAFEAAFIGKRLINLVPFPPASFEYPLFFPFKQEFYYGTDGLWNAGGFSECVRTFRAEEWTKFTEWGRNGVLDPGFSAEARRRVVEKAIGFDDFKASHRFLDLVESVLKE